MALSKNDLQYWLALSSEVIVHDVYDKDDIYFSSIEDGEDADKLMEALKIAYNCVVRIYPLADHQSAIQEAERGMLESGWVTVILDTDGPAVTNYADSLTEQFDSYLN